MGGVRSLNLENSPWDEKNPALNTRACSGPSSKRCKWQAAGGRFLYIPTGNALSQRRRPPAWPTFGMGPRPPPPWAPSKWG